MKKGIRLKNVSFGYQKEHHVLENISYEIKPGIFLGITGINGSGKSTFTYLLNGLIPHFFKGFLEGEVQVDGVSTKSQNTAYFAHQVGMVFQNPDFSLFNLTVEEEILFGMKNLKLGNTEERTQEALKEVKLPGYENRDPQTLSFGEKQKVCLASALVFDTPYIVLDEPTAMLDYKNSLELYAILHKLNNCGKTIIVVEHDTDFLWQFTKEVIILDQGKIFLSGDNREILSYKNKLQNLGIKVPDRNRKI